MIIFLLLLVHFSQPSFAIESAVANVENQQTSKYFVLGNYSPVDLLIPGKYGLTFGWLRNADKSWELEYLRGSISVPWVVEDLGKMTDQRISLIGRSYFGTNSFNFSYGLTYFGFSMHLGERILSSLIPGTSPSVELVEVNSLGFNMAVGNRWSFKKNMTLGMDWISWEQPVYLTRKQSAFLEYTQNQDNRNSVDKAIGLISYFPRLTVLKLQLGIFF